MQLQYPISIFFLSIQINISLAMHSQTSSSSKMNIAERILQHRVSVPSRFVYSISICTFIRTCIPYALWLTSLGHLVLACFQHPCTRNDESYGIPRIFRLLSLCIPYSTPSIHIYGTYCPYTHLLLCV